MLCQTLCFCLLMLTGAGQAKVVTTPAGGDSTTSEQLLVQLSTMVYRLSTDVGSLTQDVKRMLWYSESLKSTREEEEASKNEVATIPSCEGKQEGLVLLRASGEAVTVPCDGQGWITFLRRVDDEHHFTRRNWTAYKDGFGNPSASFWLGLQTIHLLTKDRPAVMRVELEAWDGEQRYTQYSFFRVDGEDLAYRLQVDGYTGTAGDGLHIHNGMRFSTLDRDNDEHPGDCARHHGGGWWYWRCFHSLLTSEYVLDGVDVKDDHGLQWVPWKGKNYSYKRAEMKLRLD